MSLTPASRESASPFSITDWFDSREPIRQSFLRRIGWADAALHPVGQDCAFRRYFRLSHNSRTAILMEAVPDGSAIATPGHKLSDFMRIGGWLKSNGLNTPSVYEKDEALGYILLEDFGNASFKQALANGESPDRLYGLAVDVLAHIRDSKAQDEITLPSYYDSHVHVGRRRVVDWFIPALHGRKNEDGLVQDYLAVWDGIEKTLPPCPQGFLHIDYHVENLMWLPGRDNLQACGMLDFQGAMTGPVPYDLANLLEDAREEISPELRQILLARFTANLPAADRDLFQNWYRILATQFHCRVIGQFIRLALRDNKTRYLDYMPRLAAYLREGLQAPILAPLKDWFDGQGVDFKTLPVISADTARFIREDAF